MQKNCGVMHIGCRNPKFDHFNNVVLLTINTINDLGITLDDILHFSTYVDAAVAKAYFKYSCILNGFCTTSTKFLLRMHRT